MNKILEIKNVSKKFNNNLILNNLNISFEKSKIVGILGPNGSGKTTLLKMIANISRIDRGEILINGIKPSIETKKIISYLPDNDFINQNIKVSEMINIYNKFFKDFQIEKAKNLINKMNIDENTLIPHLSKGNREKLSLSLILSRKAKIYILDEPIAGVDIITRDKILELLVENIFEDSLVLITTHLIKDIEKIFDEVCFLKNGKINEIYKVEDIREKYSKTVEDLYRETFNEREDI